MKTLIFPAEGYIKKDGKWAYVKTETSIVGKLELLWASVQESGLKDLKLKDHKSNKKLKKAIRLITRFKDNDEDSRISNPGEQVLVLEDSEYELLLRHIEEGNTYSSKVSDDLIALNEIISSPK